MRGFGDHGFSFGADPFGMRAAFRASPWGVWMPGGDASADPFAAWTGGWTLDPASLFGFDTGPNPASPPGFMALAVTMMVMGAFAAGIVAGLAAAAALSAASRGHHG